MSLSFQTNVTALTAETNLQVNSNFQVTDHHPADFRLPY